MTWRSILPWAALAGVVIGIMRDDLFLLIVAAVLLAVWYSWRRSLPEPDPDAVDDAAPVDHEDGRH